MQNINARPVSGGRSNTSRTGGADGRNLGPTRGRDRVAGHGLDLKVDDNGYAWWYLDAISDDQQNALTIIIFLGSVFSPYYARARRRGEQNPLQYCSFNAILYGDKGRWSMTERAAAAVEQDRHILKIGPSQFSLHDHDLRIQLDEVTAPIPRRLRGEIRVALPELASHTFNLDLQNNHQWLPIAPSCRVDVNLDCPNLQWSGRGYFDHNRGSEPLERGFNYWDWSRLNSEDGTTFLLYDRVLKNEQTENLLLRFDRAGKLIDEQPGAAKINEIDLKPTAMPKTRIWRMPRSIRCDPGGDVKVIRTLEDTPFYSRSEIATTLGGMRVSGVHESVSLQRFVQPIVQWMLPFRMPRRSGWKA